MLWLLYSYRYNIFGYHRLCECTTCETALHEGFEVQFLCTKCMWWIIRHTEYHVAMNAKWCNVDTRGWHSNIFCTPIFVLGQSFDRSWPKIFLSWHCIYFVMACFIAEILLDLWPSWPYTSKRYSDLTVDYREYFELTVDFYFDRGQRSEYRVYWNATPLLMFSLYTSHIPDSSCFLIQVSWLGPTFSRLLL